MSTVGRINFEPVTDIIQLHRRDFPLANPALALPTNALAIYDGEWLALDASYKLVRCSDVTSLNDLNTNALVFPTFMEPGRSDVLSTAARKTMVLFGGFYEFDTRIFDAAANLGSGDPITFVGQPLKVATISLALQGGGTRLFTGLVGHGGHAADASPIVGYVTRLPAANGGKLRFVSGGRR